MHSAFALLPSSPSSPSTNESCTSQTPTLPYCLTGPHAPRLPPTTVRRIDYRSRNQPAAPPGPPNLSDIPIAFAPSLVVSVVFVFHSHAKKIKEGESLEYRITSRRNFQSHKQALLRHILQPLQHHLHANSVPTSHLVNSPRIAHWDIRVLLFTQAGPVTPALLRPSST